MATDQRSPTADDGSNASVVGATSEKRLITMLLENYRQNGIDGRPVLNTSATLPVSISFSLIQILHFDPVQNVITLVGWSSLRWRDVLLRWNAYEFDNIRQVVLRPDQIWTPDVVLFNAISPPRIIHDTRLIVAQNGDVLWTTHAQYQLTCSPASVPQSARNVQLSSSVPLQPATWPRSRDDFGGNQPHLQSAEPSPSECQLRFGSWTLSADMLRLQTTDQAPSSWPAGQSGQEQQQQQQSVWPRGRTVLPGAIGSILTPVGPGTPPIVAGGRDRLSGSSGSATLPPPLLIVGDAYVPNADWDLTSTTVVTHDVEYPCCPGRKYADVTYSLRLVRRLLRSSSMQFGAGGGFQQQQGPKDARSRSEGKRNTVGGGGMDGGTGGYGQTTSGGRVSSSSATGGPWMSHEVDDPIDASSAAATAMAATLTGALCCGVSWMLQILMLFPTIRG